VGVNSHGSAPDAPETQSDYSGYYHRPGQSPYGSAERLQALADGYFGLNIVFLVNVALALASRGVQLTISDLRIALFTFVGFLAGTMVVVSLLTYPCNRRIGIGKGWPEYGAVLASGLMGLNSALCCGVIGYLVMQQIASNEMKRYGLRSGFFGIRKKDVRAKVEQLRSQAAPGFQP
jgi:hypothetical protein